MKTYVVNRQENTRVPFLRGILVRTLLDAGLSFDDAYTLATRVRDELGEAEEITSDQLRQTVTGLLAEIGSPGVQQHYRMPVISPARILVTGLGGSKTTFSRGRHQRYLQSSGVRLDAAERITTRIYDQLLAHGASQIKSNHLGYLTFLCLQQELGEAAAQQYRVWSEFQHSGRPLILLICGAVGSGKSTLATEIAHRLDIVRTQSTDMLREVMRTMIPKKLLPILHSSSFDAWRTLPNPDKKRRDKDVLIAEGYRRQADLLAVPCEAVIQRALKESVPLILEGVHSHPELLRCLPAGSDAIIVHITLAVMRPQDLKTRLRGRGVEVPQRRAKRYIRKFDSIWRLQNFLLSEAERCDTPIIPNDDKEAAIFQVIGTVNSMLSQHFIGKTDKIYGSIVNEIESKSKGKSWQEQVPFLIAPDSQFSLPGLSG